MTEYVLQHKTSRRYIATPPSLGALLETDEARGAYRWSSRSVATLEREYLYPFVTCYDIVPVAGAT